MILSKYLLSMSFLLPPPFPPTVHSLCYITFIFIWFFWFFDHHSQQSQLQQSQSTPSLPIPLLALHYSLVVRKHFEATLSNSKQQWQTTVQSKWVRTEPNTCRKHQCKSAMHPLVRRSEQRRPPSLFFVFVFLPHLSTFSVALLQYPLFSSADPTSENMSTGSAL